MSYNNINNTNNINIDNDNEFYDIALKISICGDSKSGKTRFINEINTFYFNNKQKNKIHKTNKPYDYHPTIGIDFILSKYLFPNNLNAKIQLWDMAGSPVYFNIIKSYFNSCCSSIIMCDLNNKNSYKTIETWYSMIKEKINNEIYSYPIIIIGNNSDNFLIDNDNQTKEKKENYQTNQTNEKKQKKSLFKPYNSKKKINHNSCIKNEYDYEVEKLMNEILENNREEIKQFSKMNNILFVEISFEDKESILNAWNLYMQLIYNMKLHIGNGIKQRGITYIYNQDMKYLTENENLQGSSSNNIRNIPKLENTNCCTIL